MLWRIRYPSVPAAELTGHHAVVDGFEWAPHSSCHMCTVGDDRQALIWDLQQLPENIDGEMNDHSLFHLFHYD